MIGRRIVPVLLAGCLVVPAAAEDALPRNSIDCGKFIKEQNGSWRAREITTFDIGDVTSLTVGPSEISPGSLHVGGVDVYEVLEKKCGSK